MRTFITACVVAAGVAIGAAIVLNSVIQESSATAFSTSATRI
jgi:hypothetical protein